MCELTDLVIGALVIVFLLACIRLVRIEQEAKRAERQFWADMANSRQDFERLKQRFQEYISS
mgnify:CR=1 FL=1